MQGVELLSPAGDFQTALAAFNAGADAVYCGLSDFSARAFATNLSMEDLRELMRVASARDKKVYVTFNTVIDECDLECAVEMLSKLDDIHPDGLIVQDIGIAKICREHFPRLVLHASTQMVAHNLEGVLAMKDLGFRRVVLARELSLEEIRSIAKRCGDVELECFIHGALCYSVSGLCLFSAMKKGRSGNRGKCAYCCRLPYDDGSGNRKLAFSMKDLRIGEDVRKLVDAGVISLKIEGRMKSELYVASVTRHYRQILDGERALPISDLETVFSRRTTKLYLNGKPGENVIDTNSLGHLGAEIGVVKRITRDRDGVRWLRFHTSRALEKHDGLQFETMVDGKHLGMGIDEMRQAISRHLVFEVVAGADVEVRLPDEIEELKTGTKIYCSASQAVRRRFPPASYRPSDYGGRIKVDVVVQLRRDSVSANGVMMSASLEPAKDPTKTYGGVEKAFAKLGGTDYRLGKLTVLDEDRMFVPMSVLNELRRELVRKLDDDREHERAVKLDKALLALSASPVSCESVKALNTIKIRPGQKIPAGDWNEVIVVMGDGGDRVATPVYTGEMDFGKLRVRIKGMIRNGCRKWEVSDLATLRLLRQLGIEDITADWTLYAFNSQALAQLSSLGVKRFVASPENLAENLRYLAESGYAVEFLKQQSTPLFISLTQPAPQTELSVFMRDGLWVTTEKVPRTFDVVAGSGSRVDISWDPA